MQGRVALVTGGTDGVGLRIAQRLAGAGATVVVNGRDPDRGRAALDTLRAVSADAEFERGDCSEYTGAADVVSAVAGRHGGLDVLVCAGAVNAVGPKPFAELRPDELDLAFRSRIMPKIYPVHAAAPALRERGGAVVLLTTDAARHPTPGEAIMGAAGAALVLMTKVLAKEFARDRVRVNSVAMTITSDTPSWDRIFANPSFQQRLFTKAVERFPMGRPPTADEVADVAAFLASDAAAQVTGQTISVNGGLSFGGW